MAVVISPRRCYLVEWYRGDFVGESLDMVAAKLGDCAGSTARDGTEVELLTMLAVPADEVVFGVFAASSADLVAGVCQRAGIPAQRLSVAIDARSGAGHRRETPDES